MGREAQGQIGFQGKAGPGKLLLESDALILRGAAPGRIARDEVTGFAVQGDDLVIQTRQGDVVAALGAKEAAAWVRALAKPVPGLAEKLGISAARPVCVLGPLTDDLLMAAVADLTMPANGTTLFLAELPDAAAFEAALAVLARHPDAAFWGVTVKGRSAFPEAQLRAQMRGLGYVDSKSCAVSDRMTATRYAQRR